MTRSLTPVLALAATATLVTCLAAPASAVVTVSTGGSVYGDATAENISLVCTGGNFYANGVTAGQACTALTNISVSPGAGADTVNAAAVDGDAFPSVSLVTAYLDDDEADTFTGSPKSDSVTGDRYDTISTGAGDDRIEGARTAIGGFGDDVISEVDQFASGGPGDDRIVQTAPLGGVEGGEGYDTWEVDFDLDSLGSGLPSVVFTVSGSALVLTVPGTPTVQSVPISGLEHIEATVPRSFPSTWDGSAFPGTWNLRGFSQNDVVVGGPLADVLSTGGGNDTVTGGPGMDQIVAGVGDDTINARDGEVDTIFCGDGTDTVVADAADLVSGCEVVQLPPVTPQPVVVPVTKKVKGKASYEKGAVAKFTLRSRTAGATFQCKLDKGGWKACTPTHKVKTARLKVGTHTLQVRAVLNGTVDPTPAKKKFTVTR